MARPSPKHSKHPTLIAVGQTIQAKRSAAGLSQEQLAHAADMDRSYLGGIERGEHNLTVMNLTRLAAALRVNTSTLLQESGL